MNHGIAALSATSFASLKLDDQFLDSEHNVLGVVKEVNTEDTSVSVQWNGAVKRKTFRWHDERLHLVIDGGPRFGEGEATMITMVNHV